MLLLFSCYWGEDHVNHPGSLWIYFGGPHLATHKSAEKRARQSLGRTARNKQALGAVRTFEKKIRTAVAAGDTKVAQELLKDYTSKATRAALKGVIHAKAASRKISQLAQHIKSPTKNA